MNCFETFHALDVWTSLDRSERHLKGIDDISAENRIDLKLSIRNFGYEFHDKPIIIRWRGERSKGLGVSSRGEKARTIHGWRDKRGINALWRAHERIKRDFESRYFVIASSSPKQIYRAFETSTRIERPAVES